MTAVTNDVGKYALGLESGYDGVPIMEARQRLLDAGANGAVMGAFQGMYSFVTFYNEPDYEGLKQIIPHVIHFHGKFPLY